MQRPQPADVGAAVISERAVILFAQVGSFLATVLDANRHGLGAVGQIFQKRRACDRSAASRRVTRKISGGGSLKLKTHLIHPPNHSTRATAIPRKTVELEPKSSETEADARKTNASVNNIAAADWVTAGLNY